MLRMNCRKDCPEVAKTFEFERNCALKLQGRCGTRGPLNSTVQLEPRPSWEIRVAMGYSVCCQMQREGAFSCRSVRCSEPLLGTARAAVQGSRM